jgi:hypothetical protein
LNEHWLTRVQEATISIPKSFELDKALEWFLNYQSLEQVWFDCPQGDWLIWLALLFIENEDFHHHIVSAIFTCCEMARQHVEKEATGPAIASHLIQQWLENNINEAEINVGISNIMAAANPLLYDANRDPNETLGVRIARSMACSAYNSCLYAMQVNDQDFLSPVLAAYSIRSAAHAISYCHVLHNNNQLSKDNGLHGQLIEHVKKKILSEFAKTIREVVPCPKP